jgi:hypothetical protein
VSHIQLAHETVSLISMKTQLTSISKSTNVISQAQEQSEKNSSLHRCQQLCEKKGRGTIRAEVLFAGQDTIGVARAVPFLHSAAWLPVTGGTSRKAGSVRWIDVRKSD